MLDAGVDALARNHLNPHVYHLSTGVVLQQKLGLEPTSPPGQVLPFGDDHPSSATTHTAALGEVVDGGLALSVHGFLCGGRILRRDAAQSHPQGATASKGAGLYVEHTDTSKALGCTTWWRQQGADHDQQGFATHRGDWLPGFSLLTGCVGSSCPPSPPCSPCPRPVERC